MSARTNDTPSPRPGQRPGPDPIDVRTSPFGVTFEWFARILAPDQHCEVRAFGGRPKVVSARFGPDRRAEMVDEALRLSAAGREVYFVLNPILPETAGPATDGAIERRRLLLIDCDPARDEAAMEAAGDGAKLSASDVEKAHAGRLFLDARDFLRSLGWPGPVEADSGNGYHLLYPLDLPNDLASRDLVKAVLVSLARRFDTADAAVDTVVFNASRISKFYGTVARKGVGTPDRPHRTSAVLAIPEGFGSAVVSRDQLLELLSLDSDFGPDPDPDPPAVTIPIKRPRPMPGDDGRWTPEARALAYLQTCEPAVSGQKGHSKLLKAACKIGPGFDLHPDTALKLLRDVYNPTCDPEWSEMELQHKVDEAYKIEGRRGWLLEADREATPDRPRPGPRPGKPAGGDGPDGDGETVGPNEAHDDPHRLARLYRDSRCSHDDGPTLVYHQGEWLRWDGSYRPVLDKEIRAELAKSIKAEFDRLNVRAVKADAKAKADAPKLGGGYDGIGKEKPPPKASKVTSAVVGNAALALSGYTLLPGSVAFPAWLSGDAPWPADEVLPTGNALVHLPSFAAGRKAIRPPTPLFYCPYSTGYDFDPRAAEPENWHAFLRELWPDDPQSPLSLAEWFGYHLLPDMRQHKIGALIGPKRSGKGTIARVLTAMIGEGNVCNPTLSGLGTQFGVAPLIGKLAAIITDARLSGRSDIAQIVENLLSISGQDGKTIDRKHLPSWTGNLTARFTLLSNEVPRLSDASAALAGRMIIFRLTRSFYGREDTELLDRLLPELPGILLWSIRGWKRLKERGHFIQPETGASLVQEMEELSSPIGMFVRDCCEVGPGRQVEIGTCFNRWKDWCQAMNRDQVGDQAAFGRNLRTVIPALETTPVKRGGRYFRVFEGIDLKLTAI